MEPISMTVAAVLAALAAKAGDRAAEATVEGGEGVLRRLAGRLRERFSDAGDDRAVGTLELIERVLDSAQLVRDLADAVDRQVVGDAVFAGELEELVKQARSEGVRVEQVSQAAWGDGNVQIGGVSGSEISIGQPSSPSAPKRAG